MSECQASFELELGPQTSLYYDLLQEEDFDFKTKDITIDINKVSESKIAVQVDCNTLIDLKIANSALIKSLEVIQKTLTVE